MVKALLLAFWHRVIPRCFWVIVLCLCGSQSSMLVPSLKDTDVHANLPICVIYDLFSLQRMGYMGRPGSKHWRGVSAVKFAHQRGCSVLSSAANTKGGNEEGTKARNKVGSRSQKWEQERNNGESKWDLDGNKVGIRGDQGAKKWEHEGSKVETEAEKWD